MNKSSIITVRQATTEKEMQAVYQLAHDNFVEKKLIREQQSRMLINNKELDFHQDTQVFLGLIDEEIRGTLSISVHRHIEEVYNFAFFSEFLQNHYDQGALSFSGWRLATQGSPLQRYLLTISLIIHGNHVGMQLGIRQAFFSFIPAQGKVYKNLFPNGKILGSIRKKTDLIDSELVLMKYQPGPEEYQHLAKLREEVFLRFRRKTGQIP
jgi:hypothetical protein